MKLKFFICSNFKNRIMKKILLLSFGIFLSVLVFGQQIAKNYVVVETCTEDGCVYCPYAQNGLQYLMDNGYNVIPVHYHYSSSVGNSYGNARMGFYNIPGFPTSYFNGENEQVGGYSGTNNDYKNAYNAEIAKTTSFKCNVLSVYTANDLDYTVKVRIEKVADYSGTIKLITAVTENRVAHNWEGLTYVNYLQRTMVPDNNGTALSMNTGDVDTITLNFSIESSWNTDSLYFVAFVQDMGSKEILQADRKTMSVPAGNNNVIVKTVTYPQDGDVICERSLSPEFQIKNKGFDTLTSCDFILNINGENLDTLHWTGNLPFPEVTLITFDEVSYTQNETNSLTVTAVNPNGVDDDYPDNNEVSIDFTKSDGAPTIVYLDMNTGNWGFEISYALFDDQGVKIDSSGTLYGNQTVADTFELELDRCYYFEIYDSYGNGFNSDDGYCKLLSYSGNELVNISGDFGEISEYNFRTTSVAALRDVTNTNLSVYPNPVDNTLFVKFEDAGNYNVKLFNIAGAEVANRNITNANSTWFDVSSFPQGVYFLTIESATMNISKKVIIK